MARPRKNAALYVATESFASEIGVATAGVTRVREGSEMLKRYPQWFQRIDEQAAHYEAPEVVEADVEERA